MKRMDKSWARIVGTASLTALVAANMWSCDSRPSYWRHLSELTSNCDGDVKLHILHDPEPTAPSAQVADESLHLEDAKRIASVAHDNDQVRVVFSSGVTCRFPPWKEEGECQAPPTVAEATKCSARLKTVQILAPSISGGWAGDDPNTVALPREN